MRKLLYLFPAVITTAGCARVAATSEVRPDGSMTRTLVFRGAPSDAVSPGPKIRDVFELPAGAGWKISTKREDEEVIYTAVRELGKDAAGTPDIIVRAKRKTGGFRNLVANEFSVRELTPGRLEYREVLKWQGERPPEAAQPAPELGQAIREALPPEVAGAEDVRAFSSAILRELWRMMFGPGDPVMAEMLTHPDLIERKIRRRLGTALLKALQERFGERLTRDQQVAIVRKLTEKSVSVTQSMGKSRSRVQGAPEKEEESTPVPILIAARLPGKILETNGEVDEAAGEVYWALYAEAAALEDVTLTAVCEAPAKAASTRRPDKSPEASRRASAP